MTPNNQWLLSEAVQYYEDFDGELEESLFAWMVERVKKAERYEQALKDIAEDNGTPSAAIAAKALEAE